MKAFGSIQGLSFFRKAHWISADDVKSYDVALYRDGTIVESRKDITKKDSISQDEFITIDFTDKMKIGGEYYVEVIPKGDFVNYGYGPIVKSGYLKMLDQVKELRWVEGIGSPYYVDFERLPGVPYYFLTLYRDGEKVAESSCNAAGYGDFQEFI